MSNPTPYPWEDPPQVDTGGYAPIIRQLQQNPGRWARVASDLTEETANNRANYMRKLGLTVARRKVEGHFYCLWAVWFLPDEA
jgi:hypothetical protein